MDPAQGPVHISLVIRDIDDFLAEGGRILPEIRLVFSELVDIYRRTEERNRSAEIECRGSEDASDQFLIDRPRAENGSERRTSETGTRVFPSFARIIQLSHGWRRSAHEAAEWLSESSASRRIRMSLDECPRDVSDPSGDCLTKEIAAAREVREILKLLVDEHSDASSAGFLGGTRAANTLRGDPPKPPRPRIEVNVKQSRVRLDDTWYDVKPDAAVLFDACVNSHPKPVFASHLDGDIRPKRINDSLPRQLKAIFHSVKGQGCWLEI